MAELQTPPAPSPPSPDPTAARLAKRTGEALSALDSLFKDSGREGQAKKRKKSTTSRTSTPALEAILARTARPSSSSASPAQPVANYDPSSLPFLLSRLSTYRLSSFSPSKPPTLSSLSCALHGWLHTPSTRDRVQCVSCGRGVVLLPPSTAEGGWSSPAGVKLKEEYEKALLSTKAEESLHKETCPWRMRPCARSLYRLPGAGLGVQSGGRRRLLEEVGRIAGEMEEFGLGGVGLDLPKEAEKAVSDEKTRERFVKAVRSVAAAAGGAEASSEVEQPTLNPPTLLLAIFGWSLSPPSSSSSTSSLSRSAFTSSLSSIRSLPPSSSTTPILSCSFCNRQVLATSYLPSPSSPSTPSTKRFNPITQHQPFCPFVDAYAGVPQLPAPTPASVSAAGGKKATPAPAALKPGWQIRLEAVLQRPITAGAMGHGQGSRTGAGAVTDGEEREEGGGAANLVGAGKTHELLSYVRGLLGPKIKLPSSRLSLPGSGAGRNSVA